MGATNFLTTSTGKTAAEAYRRAVEQAEYEYGHDGYNGTISTTNGWVGFDLPPRWTAEQAYAAAFAYESHLSEQEYEAERRAAGRKPTPRRRPVTEAEKADRARQNKWAAQERALVKRALRDFGEYDLRRLMAAATEKWGACVCVELNGREKAEAKRMAGREKSRDRAFAFFGLAAM